MGAEYFIESMVNFVGALLILFLVIILPIIAFVRAIINISRLLKYRKEDNKAKRNNCIANIIIDVLIITVYLLGYAFILIRFSNGMAHM